MKQRKRLEVFIYMLGFDSMLLKQHAWGAKLLNCEVEAKKGGFFSQLIKMGAKFSNF